MNQIKSIFASIAMSAAVVAVIAGLIICSNRQAMQYEAAHNCRYDYNGLCYTYEERGYLWPDDCAADSNCAEKWGL